MNIDYTQYYWQTGRIRLRRMNADDVARSVAFDYQSYDRYLWDGEIEPPPSPEARRKRFEQALNDEGRSERPMLLIETLDGDYIGLLNIHTYNPRPGTFGMAIYVVSEQRGKGYAIEAMRKVANYMFAECRMHKWVSGYVEENIASAALHRKMGHVIEGVTRDSLYRAGRYRNEVCTGLLRDEFYAIRENWEGFTRFEDAE